MDISVLAKAFTSEATPGTTAGLAKDQIISLVRQALLGAGVFLVTFGVFTDAEWAKYMGAAIDIIIPLWVMWSNVQMKRSVIPAAIKAGSEAAVDTAVPIVPHEATEKQITAALNKGEITVTPK